MLKSFPVMVDVWRSLILSLLLLVAVAGGVSHGVDFEYIPPEKQKSLETQFNTAHKAFPTKKVVDKEWKCDMYGMRSRLRVERNVHLYKFKIAETNRLTNFGAQILETYAIDGDGLISKNDDVEDTVRMTTDGELIARLSSLHPEKRVAAYAVCTAL